MPAGIQRSEPASPERLNGVKQGGIAHAVFLPEIVILMASQGQPVMTFFKLEFSKAAYAADFAVYLVTPVFIAWMLLHYGPHAAWLRIVISIIAGLVGWTLIEYVLHRFILHGLQPFKRWHAQHHLRPHALIGTPTPFSLILILICVFLPTVLVGGNVWLATGLTLGVITGYAIYSLMHHAVHHWRANFAWLKRRKRLHAIHHHARSACDFGVVTSFWDRVFRTHVDQL